MLQQARQFFNSPLKEKLSISYESSPAFRGYMALGVENTAGRMDQREQVEYAVETETCT
jgi:isopenicillin N synthase-like dioxygenase